MKNKHIFTGIQKKILLLILFSAALSVITTFLLWMIVFLLHFFALLPLWVDNALYSMRVNVGANTIVMGFFIFLFLLYVVFLSKKWARDFEQILQGTEKISKGDFQYQILVHSENELGELTGNINHMSVQLQQSIDEERRAVQARNELITNVSHDLRTPLTSILGYLRLIDEDRYKDEVELRYFTKIAYEKSQRLEHMVNDLFEFTRVNYGKVRLNRTEIDLIQLLSQIKAQFIPQLKEANMKMNVQFSNETVMLSADGDKLVRVFENLIANGIKYGKEGRKIDLKVYEEEETAAVEVINYGARIPSADLPHVFERFYRVEKSRTTDSGGSGLGLAISKGIVELHEGVIDVASTETETTFKVQLPLA